MLTQQIVVLLVVGTVLTLLGVATWRNPLWFYRAGYRWLSLGGNALMRPSQRRDKELLFHDPDRWRARHRGAVAWVRVTTGLGALIIGLLLIGLGVIQWVSKSPR